jgi:amino acid transporter
MRKTKMFNCIALSLIVLSLLVSNASADIGLSDFTGGNISNPLNGLGDAKDPMIEVVLFSIALFLVTCVLGVFFSGSVGNVGAFIHNVSLRSKGIGGIVTILGVIFAVIIVLILLFHFSNKYLLGRFL